MPLPTSWRRLWTGAAAALLAACAPLKPSSPPPAAPPGAPDRAAPAAGRAAAPRPSAAGTAREYRRDAATHLYALNATRIYPGKLPPMLYAVAVLEVDLDRDGGIRRLNWLRAPRHAPEVVREIERTVREAAPFPKAVRLGAVRYVDTWLWDRSGRFQLDTLSEGQL
ncbi:hypothetical protein [Pseudorhodoferax sp.]|uniref:hypothetical protein n=1 Tax=Pseudorhodoferax sp. TaxID=1993553 RepID=UPI0039E37C2B